MKKLLVVIFATLFMVSCVTDKKKTDATTIPVETEDHSQQNYAQPSEPDAVSQGAGEAETINESNNSDQSLIGAHAATYHFGFDQSAIQEEDKADLAEQVKYLQSHPEAKVLLSGHTDEIGSREYNVALGERRANSILNYLKFAGIKPAQIRVLSYGQEKPKALGHNQDAYRINRRVELTYEVS